MCKFISFDEYWKNVNGVYLPNNNRKTDSKFFDKKHGNIEISSFSTGLGITYSTLKGNFNEDTIIEGINKDEFSFICFNVGDKISMKDKKDKKKLDFNSYNCLNGSLNKGESSYGYYKKDNYYSCHYITINNNLFRDIIKEKANYLNSKPIFKSDSFYINFNSKMNVNQKKILHDLSTVNLAEGILKDLFVESRLLDLVYTTVNEFDVRNLKDDEIYLNEKDIESLKKSKKILTESLENPPSLVELARKCAINEYKLKKGFKQLFGNTVYGFLQEYRLNKSKELLENNEINVSEACFLVGYKSISHFSKIFKEHFGINPIEVKKNTRKYFY